MKSAKSFLFYLGVGLLIISVLVQETEARRKILRGRKALTRTYYRGNAVPAWAISVIVGVCMLVIGGILYGVMRKLVLSDEEGSTRITYHQPPIQDEV